MGEWWRQLVARFCRTALEDDLDEELRFHLDMKAKEVGSRAVARRVLGSPLLLREQARDVWGWRVLDDLLGDVRHAVWRLQSNAAFSIVVIAMLGLGLGMSAAAFTIVKTVLFDGFAHVQRNDRLVYLRTIPLYYPDFDAWRTRATAFQGMSLLWHKEMVLSDDTHGPETLTVTQTTPDLLRVLGVRPILGRDFLPEDGAPGAAPVLLLRHELWVRRFGRDPDVVGRTVRVNGDPATVIGVMPRGFSFPADQGFWTPLVPTEAALRRESGSGLYAVGRLADRVTLARARAELKVIQRQLAGEQGGDAQATVLHVGGFRDWYIGADATTVYGSIWLFATLVLVAIVANVTNLSVERVMARSREVAIRLSLGAGRARVTRQIVVEHGLLALLGGVVGWWVAEGSVRAYAVAASTWTASMPHVFTYIVDTATCGYLLGIAVVTGMAVSGVTAARVHAIDIQAALKDGSPGSLAGRQRLPDTLVGVQVVLAVALVATSSVLARSLIAVSRADLGVRANGVLSVPIDLYDQQHRYPTAEAQRVFFNRVEAAVRTLPGVESVAFGSAAPTERTWPVSYEPADHRTPDPRARPTVGALLASPDYFSTLGATLIAGRTFGRSDHGAPDAVVIVNRAFAHREWPGENPIGRQVRLFDLPWGETVTPWLTVVGVVSDIVQDDRTRQRVEPLVYRPHAGWPGWGPFMFVRSSLPAAGLSAAIRREIYALNPALPLRVLWPLEERLGRAYGFERQTTMASLTMAVVALIVAAMGLYAILAHTVRRRGREIGLRLALGATRRHIVTLVLRRGAVPVGVGLVAGTVTSVGITDALQSQLVATSPMDPVAMMAACAVLVLSAALGSWIPSRRALSVDPALTLRQE